MRPYLLKLLAIACFLVPVAARSGPGVDVFFPFGSAELRGEEIDKLEVLLCEIGKSEVEVLVTVGHASSDEAFAQLLSEQRARSVKQWIVEATGWSSDLVFPEGKGAKEPVADNQTPQGRAKNRRVEAEVVLKRRPSAALHCRPLWQNHFLDLPGDKAISVARSKVRSGWVEADAPLRVAMNENRLDLFKSLLDRESGVRLNAAQQGRLALLALHQARPDFFRELVKAKNGPLDYQLLKRFDFLCQGIGNRQDRADLVLQLLDLGIKPENGAALQCVARTGEIEIANLLLSAGAARFLTPETVVNAGPHPLLLDRLLQAGADPRSRTALGITLFHTFPLKTVADVQRMLDFGLDINAKGRIYSQNPETTPLGEAVDYATPEVLDFMKVAGARLDGTDLISRASRNQAAQVWLVRNGIDVPNWGATLVSLASNGESSLPVFEALRNRGVDLNAKDSWGHSALSMAIRRYSPQLVRLLVDSGVDMRQVPVDYVNSKSKQSALESAESLSVFVLPPPCVIADGGCLQNQKPVDKSENPDLKRRKEQIIEILKNAQARS